MTGGDDDHDSEQQQQQQQQQLQRQQQQQPRTHYGLMVLMVLLNLDKYLVRYLPAGAKPLMAAELELTDYQTGSLYTAFLVTYLFVCPVVGVLADGRAVPKRVLMFLAVVLWSASTSATAFCSNFAGLLVIRIVCGVAECVFSTIGSSFIPDIVVPSQRTTAVAWYYAASPVGAAVGYAASATIGEHLGWRLAFGLMGLFGLLAVPLLFVHEPPVGAMEAPAAADPSGAAPRAPAPLASVTGFGKGSETKALLPPSSSNADDSREMAAAEKPSCGARMARFVREMRVFVSAEYLASLVGYAVCGFALAGLDDWLTTFLHRYQSVTVSTAGVVNGVVVIVGGLAGNFFGASGSNLLRRAFRAQPEMLFSALALLVATACCAAALFLPADADSAGSVRSGRFVGTAVLWGLVYAFGTAYQSPMVTYIINCVPPRLRSRSSAIMHFVGEIPSSSIVGAVSDSTADLRQALVIIPCSFFVAFLVWFLGALLVPPSPFHQRLNSLIESDDRRHSHHKTAAAANSDPTAHEPHGDDDDNVVEEEVPAVAVVQA